MAKGAGMSKKRPLYRELESEIRSLTTRVDHRDADIVKLKETILSQRSELVEYRMVRLGVKAACIKENKEMKKTLRELLRATEPTPACCIATSCSTVVSYWNKTRLFIRKLFTQETTK